jgi:hypothetical protein
MLLQSQRIGLDYSAWLNKVMIEILLSFFDGITNPLEGIYCKQAAASIIFQPSKSENSIRQLSILYGRFNTWGKEGHYSIFMEAA